MKHKQKKKKKIINGTSKNDEMSKFAIYPSQ